MSTNIFYNNIKNLLKSDIVLEYTEHQLREIIKCKNDIPYFLRTYVKIVNLDKGLVPFELYDYQEEYIELVKNNKRFIGLQSRQSGKTSTTAGFILHYIIYNSYKTVGILANKGSTARSILHRIKEMYNSLPIWLQIGVKTWNKGSVEFGNNTSILAGSTSEDSIRGESISLLYVDEAGYISNNIWEPFWRSTYPTIASSKNAQIIISSTPHGLNHYFKLWTDAINGRNGFKPFEVLWNRVPGRDNIWKELTIKEIGISRFDVEFNCEFQGSAGTLINGQVLKNIPFMDPIELLYDEKFSIYEMPQQGHKYVSFSDFGEGDGGDSTTAQIIDVTSLPWKQVAVYRDNEILIREVPLILVKIGKFYNNALIVGEANAIGIGILDDINFELEYDNLFYGDILMNNKPSKYFGIKTTKKSKPLGNSYLKEYIESGSLIIKDFETIGELSNYIKKGISYEAAEGEHDDLIMPLVLFSYFMQNKLWVETWVNTNTYNQKINTILKIEDDLLPMGFFSDGDAVVDLEDESFDSDDSWDNYYS